MLEHAKLWHLRLGHTPFSKLKALFPDIDVNSVKESLICNIFPTSRETRLPFHDNYIKSTHIFYLLFLDVWGPYPHKTHNGCNFFLTIVDDFSRLTWVYLLKHKLDCVDIVKHLFTFIQNQYHTCVKVVRTDNAKEPCEGNLLALFQQLGIEHKRSCRDTPQQNGVVELKHKIF